MTIRTRTLVRLLHGCGWLYRGELIEKAKEKISGVLLVMLVKVPASTCSIIAYAITIPVSSHERGCGRLSSLRHSVMLTLESVSGVARCCTLLVSLSSHYTRSAPGKVGVDVHLLKEMYRIKLFLP